MKQSETELAQHVADWLTTDGWEVYPEVQIGYASPRADLVALRRDIGVAWVICCKLSMSFAVIEQAFHWLWDAHWVSVAVPRPKVVRHRPIGPRVGRVAQRCLTHEGIGLLYVEDGGAVEELIAPHLNRKALRRLEAACSPEHQRMGVAGSKHYYYTPFRATRLAAEEFVTAHPRCTVAELVAGLDHHWSTDATARACVVKYIAKGVFGSIVVEPGSRPFRLIVTDAAEADYLKAKGKG